MQERSEPRSCGGGGKPGTLLSTQGSRLLPAHAVADPVPGMVLGFRVSSRGSWRKEREKVRRTSSSAFHLRGHGKALNPPFILALLSFTDDDAQAALGASWRLGQNSSLQCPITSTGIFQGPSSRANS